MLDVINCVSQIIIAVITILAFWISYLEYVRYKKNVELKLFSDYNKRYSLDPNIKAVTVYLIDYLENGGKGNIKISIYEKEMFLRFFEELQFQINKGRIGCEVIQDYFAYYAVAAAMCKPFVENTELRVNNSQVWLNCKKFVCSFYDRLSVEINEEYCKNNKTDEKLFLQISMD